MTTTVVTQITIAPEALAQLVRQAVAEALANYEPPVPKPALDHGLPPLMTRQEVAAYLRVTLNTIDNWAKDNPVRPAPLPPQLINSRVRYPREQVLAFQQQKLVRQPPAPGEAEGSEGSARSPRLRAQDLPELMTMSTASRYLAISRMTLYNWIHEGAQGPDRLMPQTVDGRLRYRKADVLAFQKVWRPELPTQAGTSDY